MKTSTTFAAYLIAALSSLGLPASAQGDGEVIPMTTVSSSDGIRIEVVLGHLVKESAAVPATQSSTWSANRDIWMNALRSGAQSGGSVPDFTYAAKSAYLIASRMITSTTGQSWNAAPHAGPTSQWGGRAHAAVGVTVKKSGVTFMPKDIVITARSYSLNTMWFTDGVIVTTATFNESLNEFRVCTVPGGIDGIVGDTVDPVQSISTPRTSFLYGGIGFGVLEYGSGDLATRLNRARNYVEGPGKGFVIDYFVQVPYMDNGEPKTAVGRTVFMSESLANPDTFSALPLNLDFGFDEGGKSLFLGTPGGSETASTSSNALYLMQTSTDLDSWSPVGSVALLGNGNQLHFPTWGMGDQRRQFRIVTIKPFVPPPAAQLAEAGSGGGNADQEGPRMDIVVP